MASSLEAPVSFTFTFPHGKKFADGPRKHIRAYDTIQEYLGNNNTLKDVIGPVVPHPRGISLQVDILLEEAFDEILHTLEEHGQVKVNPTADHEAQRKQAQAYKEAKETQQSRLPDPSARHSMLAIVVPMLGVLFVVHGRQNVGSVGGCGMR